MLRKHLLDDAADKRQPLDRPEHVCRSGCVDFDLRTTDLNQLMMTNFLFFRADASRMSWEKLKITLVHNSEWSTSNWHLVEGLSLHVSVFDVPRGRPLEILYIITWRSICMPVVIPPSVKHKSGNCMSLFQIRLCRKSWIGNVNWSYPEISPHSCRKHLCSHVHICSRVYFIRHKFIKIVKIFRISTPTSSFLAGSKWKISQRYAQTLKMSSN